MKVNLDAENMALRLWLMIHRTHDILKACEDKVFGEYKVTTEQYAVLVSIRYLEYNTSRVRPIDVARWLAHSPNSISMIVDRMVKAGLLRRQRDRVDRRVVRLLITSKGQEVCKPATAAAWEFIQKIFSELSYEDRQTFVRLLGTLQYAASAYLNPGADMEEIMRNDGKSHGKLMERLIQYVPLPTIEAKGRRGKRQKTA
jgi:DNA-binding MarR family transcriptional regulator